MRELLHEKNKNKLLLSILFLALAVRLSVFPTVFSDGEITLLGADTYYHARRILATVADFPHALAFDSYINYPYGAGIGWAPLYDVFIAMFALIIGLGKPSLYTIEATTAIVPLLLGVLTVFLVFLIAEKIFGWKMGLLSAGIFAITPSHVYVSFLGYADHHVAETLLSSAAYLFFIAAMKRSVSTGNFKSSILLFPALTGAALALAVFTWDGAPIFIGIIGIYIVVQFVLDRKQNRNSDYLVMTGGISFLVSLLIIMPFASQGRGFEIYSYLPSMFHIAFLAAFILLFVLLAAVQRMRLKEWWHYPLLLVMIFTAAWFSLENLFPQFYSSISSGISYLSGGGMLGTIQEAVPLFSSQAGEFTLNNVWMAFTFSLSIALLSVIYFIPKIIRENYPSEAVFLIVWTIVVLALTVLQKRFIYLLAVNAAIFSAYIIISALKLFSSEIQVTKRKRKKQKISNSLSNTRFIKGLSVIALLPIHNILLIKYMESENIPFFVKEFIPAKDFLLDVNIAILSIYFVLLLLKLFLSENIALKVFSSKNTKLIIGVSIIALLAVHDLSIVRERATGVAAPDEDLRDSFRWLKDNSPPTSYFDTPDKSPEYGVMSWWDYGNWILYLSRRPVVANNFQTGIDDAGKFLITPDETTASEVLERRKVRYIVTDAQMLKLKFRSIAALAGRNPGDYYGGDTPIRSVNQENRDFFATMLSRLHVFDGNGLSHYRLIYESGTTAIKSPDIKYVKIFEYVKGATLSGRANDGDVVVTLDIVTNQGRTFTYSRQAAAVNGRYEINVPYPTQGGGYATGALSGYVVQNGNTARMVYVTEEDVQDGRRIEVDLI